MVDERIGMILLPCRELDKANEQLKEILKSLGLGILIVLPFSPVTLPYIFSKAKELNIDLIPNWYKKL